MGIFAKPRTVNRVVLLDVETIVSSPYQPRRQFEPRAMQELADSIRQNGLLQPVTVRQTAAGGFELIAGERRLLACKMNGLDKLPAIIEQFDDELSATFALIENLQRKDLNYFEEAAGIQQLMLHGSMTQQQVAERLGKAQSTVANKLRLLAFSEELRRKMLESGLTERHARALLKLPDEPTVLLAMRQIIEQRMNVGESEHYIEELLTPPPAPPAPSKTTRLFIVKDLRVFLNTITKAVSTMKLAGIEIDTRQEEDEEFIQYTMRIPKKSAYRARSPHSA